MDENFYNSWDSLKLSFVKNYKQLLNLPPSYFSTLNKFDHTLTTLLSYANPDSNRFDLQVIKNIWATNNLIRHNKDVNNAVRDSMMAENIHWLMTQKFKDEKMIVWAANSHICKEHIVVAGPHTYHPMGSFLEPKFKKEDIYTIGFTSREGTHGVFKTTKLSKAESASLERWIPDEVDYAFLDLKGRSDLASETFTMRAIGHGNLNKSWQSKFDGLFYIREMYPSHKMGK